MNYILCVSVCVCGCVRVLAIHMNKTHLHWHQWKCQAASEVQSPVTYQVHFFGLTSAPKHREEENGYEIKPSSNVVIIMWLL